MSGSVQGAAVVPELLAALGPALGRGVAPANRGGPRIWWADRRLDVEGLALGSVQALASAVNARVPGARIGLDAAGVAASFDSFSRLRVNGRAPTAFAPLSGFHEVADGWVRIHANYPHHEAALLRALGVDGARAAREALARLTAGEIEDRVSAAGGVAAAVRSESAWAATPGARALADEPWIRFDSVNRAMPRPRPARGGGLPLAGVRVLALTRVIAGPAAGRILGALGADVLRIDPPRMPELPDQFLDTGWDTRSAEADLREGPAAGRVRELLAGADIVLLGYRPRGLAALGLTPAELARDYPGLAVVALDAWGDVGPLADRRGFDSIVQAAVGIADLYASGAGPGALPVQALDHATGMGMAAAAVALLRDREGEGGGVAHLSLAATAHALLRLPRPAGGEGLRDLETRERVLSGAEGSLTYAPPALLRRGAPLEFRVGPPAYGSGTLRWLSE
ncbi:CoA transferase [Mycetocola spongiae]|uniref:CoA transferase n=1 Tax=Mycetocola spongiae TaxID=2859226 RepID=UPI001CF19D65|nr:CoA transferase [Mycetocola spongiae]UCR89762.1 CoA transferase [Mycetocola spongiae]